MILVLNKEGPISKKIGCRHFNTCSGCLHDDQIDQLKLFEEARLFFAERGLKLPPLITGPSCGWRYRAKLVAARVKNSLNKIAIGLYRAGSHEVEPIPDCKVHHPRLQEALDILQRCLEEENIPPYEEQKRTGLLRYLLLALEEQSGTVQISFVVTQADSSLWQGVIERLLSVAKTLWHSIWLNHNARLDNVIWGEDWKLLWGKPWLHTRVGLASMQLHPGSFFQANVPLFRTMVKELSEWVPSNSRLLELYSGCGVMGLHLALAKNCRALLCERNPFSEKAFKASLEQMTAHFADPLPVEFIVGSAEKELALLEEAEVILVDPPRKGLDRALISSLGTCKKNTKLFYISCGFEAFKRDSDALSLLGWKLKRARAYLFFPGTEHIELLVEMEKQ